MRAKLAPGSDHRLGYSNKPALTLERGYKAQLFRRVIILIETTDLLKGIASAKQAGSAREKIQPARGVFSSEQYWSAPPWQPTFEPRPTTAPNRASTNAVQCRLNGRGIHQRVGIHKEKNVPVSLPRARIASGRNLPMLNAEHLRALLPGN
jgi:hypothetical protein